MSIGSTLQRTNDGARASCRRPAGINITVSKRGRFCAMREPGGRLLFLGAVALGAALISGTAAGAESVVVTVASKDGTPISVECIGSGPTLLLVHGGTGDRTRWTPLFPLFAPRVTACAMDRRGHGKSGDAREYSLQKEAEDVAAVVESRPGKVFADEQDELGSSRWRHGHGAGRASSPVLGRGRCKCTRRQMRGNAQRCQTSRAAQHLTKTDAQVGPGLT